MGQALTERRRAPQGATTTSSSKLIWNRDGVFTVAIERKNFVRLFE